MIEFYSCYLWRKGSTLKSDYFNAYEMDICDQIKLNQKHGKLQNRIYNILAKFNSDKLFFNTYTNQVIMDKWVNFESFKKSIHPTDLLIDFSEDLITNHNILTIKWRRSHVITNQIISGTLSMSQEMFAKIESDLILS